MNYIGSKLSLLGFLDSSITNIAGKDNKTFCDLFAGTGIVGRYFKQKGFSVISNDLQYYSFVLNRHYIGNNCTPKFHNLTSITSDVFQYLNNLAPQHGFIYKNYSYGGSGTRLYFSDENAGLCDAIRIKIESWYKNNQITDNEYYFLLSSLLESIDKYANTASVYGSYLKKLKPSAQKKLIITPAEIIYSDTNHKIFNKDANEIISDIETDILYLDPPYNERQYASNYHILETISKYDYPIISGKTGLRDYRHQKSLFCTRATVKQAFTNLIKKANAKYIFLSYNNEGLLSLQEIQEIMSDIGEYGFFTKNYNRFKSDKSRTYTATNTIEYLHWVKKCP